MKSRGHLIGLVGVIFGLALLLCVPAAVSANDDSNCPPGQPPGRPPGRNPQQPPGQPPGRPPAYPPGECNMKLSKGSAQRGESVQTSGSGFAPGTRVEIRLASGRALGTTTADASGAFTHSVTIPNDAPLGMTRVLASGGGRELSADLEVLRAPGTAAASAASAPASSGFLPATGSELAATALMGVALVGIGAVFVVGARRRHRTTA